MPQDQQSFHQIYSSFNGCISSVSMGPLGGVQTLRLDAAVYGENASYC